MTTSLLLMAGTWYALCAALGNFGRINSTVCVVAMVEPFGMPRVLFCSWVSAILHSAACPTSETEAAESINAVVELGRDRLVQPGGSLSSSLPLVERLLTMYFSPAGAPRHFSLGALPNPVFSWLPPIVLWRVAHFL